MNNILRKYPIGIQTFSEVINEWYIYIDKTDLVYQITKFGQVYFSLPSTPLREVTADNHT